MKAVVVYESMYGNTHLIAEAIGTGLRERGAAVVVPVQGASEAIAAGADLIVVGGPTHAHGMSHESTRKGAVAAAAKPESPLTIDPDAPGPSLREWLGDLGQVSVDAAAFTGRASKGITRKLRQHGARLIAAPESFLVTKGDRLEPEEEGRARTWGSNLGLITSGVASASRQV